MSLFNLFKKEEAPEPATAPEVPLPPEAPEKTIDDLAASMNSQQAVWYAAKSTEKAAGQTSPDDLKAAKAAEEWVKAPSPESKEAAAEAAKQVETPGPGMMAAKAAELGPDGVGALGALAAPALAAIAAGAVKLAGALIASPDKVKALTANIPKKGPEPVTAPVKTPAAPKIPKLFSTQDTWEKMPKGDAQKTASVLQPFIDLGNAIKQGQNKWS